MATQVKETVLQQKIKEAAQKNKELASSSRQEKLEKKLPELIQRIITNPGWSIQTLESELNLEVESINKWLDGSVKQPRASSLNEVRTFLGLDQKIWNDYFTDNIDLDELWSHVRKRRINEKYIEITPDTIYNDFTTLGFIEKLNLLSRLSATLESSYKSEISIYEEKVKNAQQIAEYAKERASMKYLSLNQGERIRLKEWLNLSCYYDGIEADSLIDKGVPGDLLESILDARGDEIPEDDYKSILPYLFRVLSWRKSMPFLDDKERVESVEQMLEDLRNG